MLVMALEYQQQGWSMVPSTGPQKSPCVRWKQYQTTPASADQLRRWDKEFHPARWGVVTGRVSGLVAVDFDGEAGHRYLKEWALQPHVRTGSRGFHVYFQHPGWPVPTLNAKTSKRTWPFPGVDVRGDGGFVALLGRNQNGPYRIVRDIVPEPFDRLPQQLRDFLRAPEPKPLVIPAAPRPSAAGRVDSDRLVRKALEIVPSNGRNNAGFWLAQQLRDNGYSQAGAESVMRNYRSRVPGTNMKGAREEYTVAEMQASLGEAYRAPARDPWSSRAPRLALPLPRNGYGSSANQGSPAELPEEGQDLLSQPFNDYGNALRIIAIHGSAARYCHEFNKWVVWDGRRWAVDKSDLARKLAQDTMLKFAAQAMAAKNEAAAKFAGNCLNSQRLTAALREAQPHLTVAAGELDTHPFQLNFLNGTVDLRTGAIVPHQPQNLITKLVH
jgi:hypothetical protein